MTIKLFTPRVFLDFPEAVFFAFSQKKTSKYFADLDNCCIFVYRNKTKQSNT